MLLAILSDAILACVCAFFAIYFLCLLFYRIFWSERTEPFSFNRFFDILRTFDQEEEK